MPVDKSRLEKRTRIALGISLILTIIIIVIPYGNYIGFPLILISTIAHEFGHGLTAVLLGGEWKEFAMYSDARGFAKYIPNNFGRISNALTAAGGLLGPSITAFICFRCGRNITASRLVMLAFAILILAVMVTVETSGKPQLLFVSFGTGILGLLALVLVAIVFLGTPWICQFSTLFIGMQLALSVFTRADYLFTKYVGDKSAPSDVQMIAEQLWLPFWCWGIACGVTSVMILLHGLRPHYRDFYSKKKKVKDDRTSGSEGTT